MPAAFISVYIKLHRQRAVLPCLTGHHQSRQVRQAVYGDMVRLPPQRQTFLRPALAGQYLRRSGVLPMRLHRMARRQMILVDEPLELQPQEYVVQLRLEGLSQGIRRLELQRRVGDDGGHPIAVTGGGLAVPELGQHTGPQIHAVDVGIYRVDASIGLYQRHGRLFADARHTGDVVRGVAHQGLQVDHVDRVEAIGLPERLRRHVLVGLPPRHPGGQLHPGMVGDEL